MQFSRPRVLSVQGRVLDSEPMPAQPVLQCDTHICPRRKAFSKDQVAKVTEVNTQACGQCPRGNLSLAGGSISTRLRHRVSPQNRTREVLEGSQAPPRPHVLVCPPGCLHFTRAAAFSGGLEMELRVPR